MTDSLKLLQGRFATLALGFSVGVLLTLFFKNFAIFLFILLVLVLVGLPFARTRLGKK